MGLMRRRRKFYLAVAATLLLVAAPFVGAWVAEVTYEPPGRPTDLDEDGLADDREGAAPLTSPQLRDTDGDGLTDGEEVDYWEARSLSSDPPAWIVQLHGLDDVNAGGLLLGPTRDLDLDGLANAIDPDADDDGFLDGKELEMGTDPADPDSDHDGVPDAKDARPLDDADVDHDGLPDDWEVHWGVSDPTTDDDGDGVENLQEFAQGTSPKSPIWPWRDGVLSLWMDGLTLDSMSPLIAPFREPDGSLNTSRPLLSLDPTTPARYLRLTVLDKVSGTTWSGGDRPMSGGDAGASTIAEYDLGPLSQSPSSYTYTVNLAVPVRGFLPAPPFTVAISGLPLSAEVYWYDRFSSLLLSSGVARSYSVTSFVPDYTLDELLAANITSGMEDFLALPGRTELLPDELNSTLLLPPLARMLEARAWLWTRAHHTSDLGAWAISSPLQLTVEGEGTSLDFASALAVLGRALDVPTRLAVGFAPGIIVGGHRLVRVGDLHAWTEIALGDYWIPIEATPIRGSDGLGLGVAGEDPTVIGVLPFNDSTPRLGAWGGGTTTGGGRGTAMPGQTDTDGDGIPNSEDTDDDDDGLTDAEEYLNGTNPIDPDTDHDGLDDADEALFNTSAVNGDTDGDGLADGVEVAIGTNPLDRDTDGAGSCDIQELQHGTDPTDPDDDMLSLDLDCDGLTDQEELSAGTDPAKCDTDGDGLTDAEELRLGTDPSSTDTDNDGMRDADELAFGTDPNDGDTDGDGLWDGWETANGTARLAQALALHADTDMDGLDDASERGIHELHGTGATSVDTDGDGLTDAMELEEGLDPSMRDTDGDGMDDLEELARSEHEERVRAAQGSMVPYLVVAAILTAALAFRYRPFDRRVAMGLLDALSDIDDWLKGLGERPEDDVRAAIYRAYEEVCRVLADHGMLREEGRTVREFEDAIDKALPWVPDALIDELTTLFEEARYSDHALPAGYVDRARVCISGIREAVEKELVSAPARASVPAGT